MDQLGRRYITNLLLLNRVILPNSNKPGYHRPSCWKDRLASMQQVWDCFCTQYRSEEEAAYCVCHEMQVPACPLCGKPVKFVGGRVGYNQTCSECSANKLPSKKAKAKATIQKKSPAEKEASKVKARQTLEQRYGDPQYGKYGSQSFKRKMLLKHGDEHYCNKKQARETVQSRYGVSCNLAIDAAQRNKKLWSVRHLEILEKRSQTCQARYGVKAVTQCPEIQQKMTTSKANRIARIESEHNCTLFMTLIKTYGQGWLKLDLPKTIIDGHSYINNEYLGKIQAYSQEGSHTNKYASKPEKDVVEFLRSLGLTVLENVTNVVKNNNHRYYELDMYLPDYKIALDFDGVYWHSSLFKDRNYHLRKTECCEREGIRLIHIFEDYWNLRREVYKSILKSALGLYDNRIYARQCEARSLTSAEYRNFLEQNHLHGAVNSSLRWGLFYQNTLVEVVGFGKSRFKEGEYELHRMCSALNTQVIGGFSKLLKCSGVGSFVSYIDRSIYSGQGYKKVGCQLIGTTPPGYHYTRDKEILSRVQCQKAKLRKLLLNYDPTLTEIENMANNRYLQIYDCGNWKVKYEGTVR